MRVLSAVLGTLLFLLVAAALAIWSGVYNVAATDPHWEVTHSILEVAREKSIEFHSGGLSPPSLQDPKLVKEGMDHFHELCRYCHGAPGFPRSEFAMGLYPSPPSLKSRHLQVELNDAEMFWVVKHGLKMTGMPAFGSTHSDEDLWGIVAVLRKLPKQSPEEYRGMLDTARVEDGGRHDRDRGGYDDHHEEGGHGHHR